MATFRQGKTGRWVAQLNKRGVRTAKTFNTKAAAKVWATREEAGLEVVANSEHRQPGQMTLSDLVQEYLAHISKHKPVGRSKRFCLVKLQEGSLGPVTLKALNAAKIVAFAEGRHAEGAGPVTVSMDLTYLTGLLKHARQRKKLNVNPGMVQDARNELKEHDLVGGSSARSRRPTASELAALRAVWSSALPFDLVEFAIASAMRAAEICRIRWEDLDGSQILVRERKHPTNKKQNDQWVPLSSAALAVIRRQPKTDERIFPYFEKSISNIHPRMCALAGIKDLRFHDYRHEGISRFFEAGLSIPEVAVISGHRSWKQLERYTNLRPEDVAAKLG